MNLLLDFIYYFPLPSLWTTRLTRWFEHLQLEDHLVKKMKSKVKSFLHVKNKIPKKRHHMASLKLFYGTMQQTQSNRKMTVFRILCSIVRYLHKTNVQWRGSQVRHKILFGACVVCMDSRLWTWFDILLVISEPLWTFYYFCKEVFWNKETDVHVTFLSLRVPITRNSTVSWYV